MASRNKKARKQEEEEQGNDRLSYLPDIIIHQIFSFLDAKFAVQTSVLSKRWKSLWTSSPNLHFDKLSSDNFVTQILSRRRDNIPLSKLYIRLGRMNNSISYLDDIPCGETQKSLVERVLDYAASRGLQHLSISSESFSAHNVPLAILSPLDGCQSLKTLNLSKFMDLSLLSFFDFPMLTTLYLHRCCIRSCGFGLVFKSIPCLDSDPFANLINLKRLILMKFDYTGFSNLKISGAQLESLTLHLQYRRCHDGTVGWMDPDPFASLINLKKLVLIQFDCTYVSNLKISGPQLESLTINNMYRYDHNLADFKVEIFAPKLKIFNYKNKYPLAFSFLDLPLLEVADIDAHFPRLEKFDFFHLNFINMLGALYHAQSLKLSANTIEVLLEVPAAFEQQSSPFTRLKTLKLQYGYSLNIPGKMMNYFLSGSNFPVNVRFEYEENYPWYDYEPKRFLLVDD